MGRSFVFFLVGAGVLLGVGPAAWGRDAKDFPLRVHIFQNSQHSHYRHGMLEYVDGEGRANLFADGLPHGFDYSFRCEERLMVSPGYETYPARWKKPGRELEVLSPVNGKPGAFAPCTLAVTVKDTAYFRHNGGLDEEPVEAYKEWMDKHQYDPEHGLDRPTGTGQGSGTGQGAGASGAQ